MSSRLKAARKDRQELEDAQGGNFSTSLVEMYGRLSEDEQEEIRKMPYYDAKKALREKLKEDRATVIKALEEAKSSATEPAAPSPLPESKNYFHGEGVEVIDLGSPGVLLVAKPTPAVVEDDAAGVGGTTIEVVVVDNGVFKTGNFYISGGLTEV